MSLNNFARHICVIDSYTSFDDADQKFKLALKEGNCSPWKMAYE